MMKKYEEPKLNLIRFEMAESVTTDKNINLSDMNNFGQDVEDW